MTTPPARVHEVAARARVFLEPRWRAWKLAHEPWLLAGHPASYLMCRFSALFLAAALGRELGGTWRPDGGDGEAAARVDPREVETARAPGGILGLDGRWHSHYWVADGDWSTIVDITADQFGHAPVIVSANGDARYRGNYLVAAIDGHMAAVERRVAAWLSDWDAAAPTPGAGAPASDHGVLAARAR